MHCLRAASALLLAAIAIGWPAIVRPASAADPGIATQSPLAQNPRYTGRMAILVVGSPGSTSPRAALAHADEIEYRARLRELGFTVHTIGPGTRPDLDRNIRDVLGRIESNNEVAIFALGNNLADAEDIFIIPGDARATALSKPELLVSEGISFGDVIRRVSARRPKTLVVIADECRRVDGGEGCPTARLAENGANAIVFHRGGGGSPSSPVAAIASGKARLTELMTREGLVLLNLFSQLREGLARSDLAASASPTLSSSFSFLPADFLSGISHMCNMVDPAASESAVRGLPTEQYLAACEEAVRTWHYSRHFTGRRTAAAEQHAFRRGVSSCSDLAASNAYLSNYPSGRFVAAVQDFVRRCEEASRPPPPPPPPSRLTARSRSGWSLTYDPRVIRLDPNGDDVVDRNGDALNSIWQHPANPEAIVFMQVSKNTNCVGAAQYFNDIVRSRRMNISTSRFISHERSGRPGHLIAGNGVRLSQNWSNLDFIDYIFVDMANRSTVVHLGARFPSSIGSSIREELNEMLRSMSIASSSYYNHCS